jgi:hypothetical protein
MVFDAAGELPQTICIAQILQEDQQLIGRFPLRSLAFHQRPQGTAMRSGASTRSLRLRINLEDFQVGIQRQG